MFLSFIPAWFACCLIYGASKRQVLFNRPLAVKPAILVALLLLLVMQSILFKELPMTSATITGLALVCCFLPLVTLINAYKKYYFCLSSILVCLLALLFTFLPIVFGGAS
jgi:hypothetical protein